MLKILGNGMKPYTIEGLEIDFSAYDYVVCDKNFDGEHTKLKKFGFSDAKAFILEHAKEKNLLYIVSGSPLFYSGAMVMLNHLRADEIAFSIEDNTSSFSYLLAKLGFAQNECGTVSLHGRAKLDLTELLVKKYTFVLCDENSITTLKALLSSLDKEDVNIFLGARFGYSDEQIKKIDLENFDEDTKTLMPFCLLLERAYEHRGPISEKDELLHENGMITKTYKRHLSLQNLDLKANELLWDIGAGSGSISVDAYKRYKVRTRLFEKSQKRSKLIAQNLHNHKVLDTKLFVGDAIENLEKESELPDKIFVGGGGLNMSYYLPELVSKLKEGGLLVANYVVLEHLSAAMECLKEAGITFDIKAISLTTYKHSFYMCEPERMMYQIRVEK